MCKDTFKNSISVNKEKTMPSYPTDIDNFTTQDQRGSTATNNVTDLRDNKNVTAIGAYALDVFTNFNPFTSTAMAHKMSTGDKVIFTTLDADTSGARDNVTIGTAYFVIKLSASTFSIATTLSNALAGTAIHTAQASQKYCQFYCPDGVYKGGELTMVSDTIYDFIHPAYDVLPATSTISGTGILAKVAKEITTFYDAIDPRRETVSILTYDAADVLATVAGDGTTRTNHGLALDQTVKFISSEGNIVGGTGLTYGSTYYVCPVMGVGANAGDTVTLTAYALPNGALVTIIATTAVGDPTTVQAAGLTLGTTYKVANTAVNTFTLTTTISNVAVPLTANCDVYFTTPKIFAISATLGGVPFNLGADHLNDMYLGDRVFDATELSYIANMESIQFNDLIKQAKIFSQRLKKLTAFVESVNTSGALGASQYPSGQNDYNQS